MKIIQGNLITEAQSNHFDVIIHGCNCFCTMGAGIAKDIKRAFPEAYKADIATRNGDRSKLGTYSSATIGNLTVLNAYTQYEYGKSRINVSYDAIQKVFCQIKRDFTGKRIGYPAIGAGLAGGDWKRIYAIICDELQNEDHTFVEYQK